MQYYREEPVLSTARAIDCYPSNVFFAFKEKKRGKTGNDFTKDVKIMVQLKHLSKFSRT